MTKAWKQLSVCLFAILQLQQGSKAVYADGKKPSFSQWTWVCDSEACLKKRVNNILPRISLNVCQLMCGRYGGLWPIPTGNVTLGKSAVAFNLAYVRFTKLEAPSEEAKQMLSRAIADFQNHLHDIGMNHGIKVYKFSLECKFCVEVSVAGYDTHLDWDTDERYELKVTYTGSKKVIVNIKANTFFGARHGIQTLSQLITWDPVKNSFVIISEASVVDKPVFRHRGVMLDTSRNYYSVKSIKRTIDAMAVNKLNVFHWHITDSHSFPLVTPRVPEMSDWGAYSPEKVYRPDDVKEIVDYARVKGIRVIPELDIPAHSGNGWQWGETKGFGELAVCVNQQPWHELCGEPPCGQLNPMNNNTYTILQEIFQDVFDMFNSSVVHMGGDEVYEQCWAPFLRELRENVPESRNLDFRDLWAHFQDRAWNALESASGGRSLTGIVWTSRLTDSYHVEHYLDKKKYVIQVWKGTNNFFVSTLLKKGFRVILSFVDAWYLDCGFGSWIGNGDSSCGNYKTWKKIYGVDPLNMRTMSNVVEDEDMKELILGGEVALWSETSDEQVLDSRLWPRAAAFAERMWSNPRTSWYSAQTRLLFHRERMVAMGIAADVVQPEWCFQNQKQCK